MTAVGTGQVDDQTQFGAGVVDILSLERLFTGTVRPHQSFVDVQQAIDGATYGYYTPTGSSADLQQNNHHNYNDAE